jgi:hypothetical protein
MKHNASPLSAGALCIFLLQCLTGCESIPTPAVSIQPARMQEECASPAKGLHAVESSKAAVEPTLSYSGGSRQRPNITYVGILSGVCAPVVREALLDLVRLANGTVYRITQGGDVVVPPPQSLTAFEVNGLSESEVPPFRKGRFLDADDYMAEEGRYLGLWADRGRWTVAVFSIRGGREVRPLFHSRLPLRSVAFFPNLDTPGGQIWIVQEHPDGSVRRIALQWRHEDAGEPLGNN